MKYILLDNDQVKEIIPDVNPELPGFPIEQRYPADFLSKLLPVEDGVEVEENWTYHKETGTFSPPAWEEPEETT